MGELVRWGGELGHTMCGRVSCRRVGVCVSMGKFVTV